MKLSCVVDHVALQAGDAPRPLLESKLLMAAQQFYNESRCLVRECDAIRLFENVRHYEIEPSLSGFGVAGIERLGVSGKALTPVSELMIDANWAWAERRGEPSHFLRQGERGVELYPTPDVGGALIKVRASLFPVSMDAEIDARDIEALTAGALGRLLVMTGVSWGNPALADYYQREFRDAISLKSNTALKGDLNVPVQVQFRALA